MQHVFNKTKVVRRAINIEIDNTSDTCMDICVYCVHQVVYNLEIVTQYSNAARIQIVLEDVK